MTIAITGEEGFIGIHLTNYFKYTLKYTVISLGKDYLDNLSKIQDLNWLIHGAFYHRNQNPEELVRLNKDLTQNTILALKESGVKCNILFLSSIHEEANTPYGYSKREARKTFLQHCNSTKNQFIALNLPNIFGAYAIPNKTSFIATFCYNFYNNIKSEYNTNEVRLCYIEDIVKIIGKLQKAKIPTNKTTVDSVYFLLKKFNDDRMNDIFTHINTKFELDLYLTYRQYANFRL